MIDNMDTVNFAPEGVQTSSALEELEEFSKWLQTAALLQSSRTTYQSRLSKLRLFILASEKAGTKGSLEAHSNNFIASLKTNKELKVRSINNMVVLFRLISKFLGREIVCLEKEPLPPEQNKGIIPLNKNELQGFIDVSNRERCYRELVIGLLCLQTGLRIGEITALKLTDLIVEGERMLVMIDSKRTKQTVEVNRQLAEAMNEWLKERRHHREASSPYLFPGVGNKAIGRSSLDMALRKIGWKSGMVLCSERLRATYNSYPSLGLNASSAPTMPHEVASAQEGSAIVPWSGHTYSSEVKFGNS